MEPIGLVAKTQGLFLLLYSWDAERITAVVWYIQNIGILYQSSTDRVPGIGNIKHFIINIQIESKSLLMLKINGSLIQAEDRL